MESKGFGNVKVPLINGNVMKLTGVAYCPDGGANFVSQRRLNDDGYRLKFVGNDDDIQIWKDDNASDAQEQVRTATRAVDRAVSKGALHRRTGSRLISRLATRGS